MPCFAQFENRIKVMIGFIDKPPCQVYWKWGIHLQYIRLNFDTNFALMRVTIHLIYDVAIALILIEKLHRCLDLNTADKVQILYRKFYERSPSVHEPLGNDKHSDFMCLPSCPAIAPIWVSPFLCCRSTKIQLDGLCCRENVFAYKTTFIVTTFIMSSFILSNNNPIARFTAKSCLLFCLALAPNSYITEPFWLFRIPMYTTQYQCVVHQAQCCCLLNELNCSANSFVSVALGVTNSEFSRLYIVAEFC